MTIKRKSKSAANPRKQAPARPKSKPQRERRYFERADRVIAFIEALIVPSGKGAGTPFKMRPFQVAFIRDIYAEHGPSRARKVRRAVLSIARKNGKTALIAALVLCHLIGPEAIQNGEIYSVANDRSQAAQVFKMAAQMIRADTELKALLRVVDSTNTIACYGNGSKYQAVSAEAGTKHGLNPSLWIYDELAQSKSRELYDVFDTSQGAQDEPLGIVISTQSPDPLHPLSEMIDDGLAANDNSIIVHLYAVPDDVKNIQNPNQWKKANPALGDFRSLTDFKALADKAKRLASYENTFRNLYLNQRVSNFATLFTRRTWERLGGAAPLIPGEEIILSLDLAGTTDLAALAALSVNDPRLRVHFWKPEDHIDINNPENHGKRDRVPYDLWLKERHLEPCPGLIIDPAYIAAKIGEYYSNYDVIGLAYDRWRMEYIKKELERAEIPFYEGKDPPHGIRLIPWGQGFGSMSPAIDELEKLTISGEISHDNNPVLNWNMTNAAIATDPAGNRKLDKHKSRFRIDGAQAAAQAVGARASLKDENTAPATPWDDDSGFSLAG